VVRTCSPLLTRLVSFFSPPKLPSRTLLPLFLPPLLPVEPRPLEPPLRGKRVPHSSSRLPGGPATSLYQFLPPPHRKKQFGHRSLPATSRDLGMAPFFCTVLSLPIWREVDIFFFFFQPKTLVAFSVFFFCGLLPSVRFVHWFFPTFCSVTPFPYQKNSRTMTFLGLTPLSYWDLLTLPIPRLRDSCRVLSPPKDAVFFFGVSPTPRHAPSRPPPLFFSEVFSSFPPYVSGEPSFLFPAS